MARYARGKWSKAQDDRTGWKVSYKDLKTEWTGVRVHKSEWEPKHPQLDPPRRINDPQALSNPRPDTTQTDAEINYNYRYANEPLNATFANGWYVGNSNFGIEVEDSSEGEAATFNLGAFIPESETYVIGQNFQAELGTSLYVAETAANSFELISNLGAITLEVNSNLFPTGFDQNFTIGNFLIENEEFSVGQSITTNLATVTLEQPGWGNNAWSVGKWGQ